MWLLTPLFGTIFGFLFLSFVMLFKIWIPSNLSPKNRVVAAILLGGKGIVGAMFSYYGILLCNTVVKVLFGGLLELSNFWFYLMGLMLMTLLAGMLFLSGVFKAPTWATLFSFLAIFAFTIYYFEFYLEARSIDETKLITIPVLMSIGVFLVSVALTLPFRIRIMKAKQNEGNNRVNRGGEANRVDRVDRVDKTLSSFEFKTLWDISDKVEKWVNKKTLGILWALFAVETFLLLEGVTLLYWVGLL
ncbi:MAG: hypothetical protein ACTSYI_06695 [Promethearchaeota archaeon]